MDVKSDNEQETRECVEPDTTTACDLELRLTGNGILIYDHSYSTATVSECGPAIFNPQQRPPWSVLDRGMQHGFLLPMMVTVCPDLWISSFLHSRGACDTVHESLVRVLDLED
jgi:hypothetical protein